MTNYRSLLLICIAAALSLLLQVAPNIAWAKYDSFVAIPANLQKNWQQLKQTSNVTPLQSYPHHHCFVKASTKHNLPLTLLLALAKGESAFNPKAISKANAIGMMQILWPGTAKHLGIYHKQQLFDPCTNVDAGTRYLKELLDRYDGDWHLALAAYNYGPGRIKPGANSIPKGALWYSSYIYDHYLSIIENTGGNFASTGTIAIMVFSRAFRARYFAHHLQKHHPRWQMEWQKNLKKKHSFNVLARYDDDEEKREILSWIDGMGIR